MKVQWRRGNSISLLENGDEFFKRVVEVVDQAQTEVLIETFILRDDPVGQRIRDTLIKAADRGVWVSVLGDGYGCHYLPQSFRQQLLEAGIHFNLHDPQPSWMRIRTNILKRLHRKILVADATTAFVGGINLEHNHELEFGPNCKQDYAVELTGPVVEDIHRFARSAITEHTGGDIELVDVDKLPKTKDETGKARVLFVTRDNDQHRTDIEKQYLKKIRQAEHRITILNCYFFPGYRMLKALRDASRRGVKVCLITQGKPDSHAAKWAAGMLYDYLIESEIDVYEYWDRCLHGKIAAIDDDWATVGSSNMDPLSFYFNLEANVFVEDREFNSEVHERTQRLIDEGEVRAIDSSWLQRRTLIKGFISFVVYHLLRRLPGLTAWVPRLERDGPFLLPSDDSKKPQDTENRQHDKQQHEADQGQPDDSTDQTDHGAGWMRYLTPVKRVLTVAFLGLVGWLLIRHAQNIDWVAVKEALLNYPWTAIAIGGAAALGSYLAYASFDLFGRHYVGHGISRVKTMAISFICCAFTLNLGALIGSIGFRYRLYSQWGIRKGAIAHIVGMTITTNWLGYLLLTGVVLVSGRIAAPFDWEVSTAALRVLGGIFLAVVLVYLLFSRFSKTRTWDLIGQTITLPSLGAALLQLLAASSHWTLMAAALYTFLHGQVDYFTVLGVLLVSSIAGVLSHVPGALGVLEAVFLTFLGDQVGPSVLLAALVAYRAVFYLFPLTLALAAYGRVELGDNRANKRAPR